MNAFQVSCLIFNLDSGDIIDLSDITKKYKILALKNHPDKNPNCKNATERFKKLKAGYDFLKEKIEIGKNIVPLFNKAYKYEEYDKYNEDYEYNEFDDFEFGKDYNEQFNEQYSHQYSQQNIIIEIIREKYTDYDLTKYSDNQINHIISCNYMEWLEFMSNYTNTKKQKRFIYDNLIKSLWKMD